MDVDKTEGQYTVKGGRTFIGKMFSYQERTGMSPGQILKLPYILFVLGMYDAPSIDYETKKEKKLKPTTAEEQVNSIISILK